MIADAEKTSIFFRPVFPFCSQKPFDGSFEAKIKKGALTK
jgi:hypothetical protein